MNLNSIRIQDVADILIMSFLVYQLYSWFRKTRAMQVLLGLGVVTLIYFATRFLGLYMTNWVLQELGTVLIVLVIVVFQAEIRQALYRFSLMRYFFDKHHDSNPSAFTELAETLFVLAEKRIGALVVLQREESLSDYLTNGVKLDCEITPQILETIFYDGTPLHDGAIIINDARIIQASCHLPLSVNADLPHHYGTRHRAALGLTERSDAVVLVVSEERGEVSSVVNGEIVKSDSVNDLLVLLTNLIRPEPEKPITSLWQRLFANLIPKLVIFIVVIGFWALVTSRQGQITTVSAPLRFHGVPDTMIVLNVDPEELEVQVKSLSSLAPAPAKLEMLADIDLSTMHEGSNLIRVKNTDFSLPAGVAISNITPAVIKIQAEKKIRKKVPVIVRTRSAIPKGYRLVVEPEYVEIEGVAAQVGRISQVHTAVVDLHAMSKETEYRKKIEQLPKNISLIGDEQITLQLIKKP